METVVGKDLNDASELLKKGELIAIPTETVYGLAGNALNEDALLHIYQTKKRPSFDPLIMHLPDFREAEHYATEIPEIFFKLSKIFCPGPLTFILKKKNIVPDIMTSGLPTVAVRVPDHPLTLQLLRTLPFPLAAPSANLFGKISPTSAQHVQKQLGGKIPYILDGGCCKIGIESTIIAFENNSIQVLRQGGISIEMLKKISTKIPVQYEGNTEQISAPGQLKSHYATHTPLITGNIEELMEKYSISNVAILSFYKTFKNADKRNIRILSPAKDFNEAAKNLFRFMHELDELGCDLILAEKLPDKGLGRAINDRLQRASGV